MNMNKSFATAPQALRFDGIEWEELPSLATTLAQRLRRADAPRAPDFHPVWDVTMPAALDPLRESGPFAEPLRGLATRELIEPDVFRHFFASMAS